MKRTPLKRTTRLKAKPKKTRVSDGRVVAVLPTRKVSKRFKARRDLDYVGWIRTLPCLLDGTEILEYLGPIRCGPSDAAHVKSRGAGGDDVGNLVPLCRDHHTVQHNFGVKSFEWLYDVDLRAEAARLAALYHQDQGPA